MGKNRTTYKNNLVIVCEGTDTEYLYFSELKDYVQTNAPDRFNSIKVVPEPEEIIQHRNPKRNHLTRKMADGPDHYFCKFEDSAKDYETFKAQPIRYVRETVLFMQHDGYTEGWAVFDNDKHPAHEKAFNYAQEMGVGIAFSSYSFEEWFLAHFERCPQAFQHSECKEDGKELKCGSKEAATGDCHGKRCIGGRLRAQSFIPDYSKNKSGLFRNHLIPLLRQAKINASWLRYQAKGELWNRNPYTDVDVLVSRMLEDGESIQWYGNGATFKYAGSNILVKIIRNQLSLTNTGEGTILIPDDQNEYWDKDLTPITSLGVVLLEPGKSLCKDIPNKAVALFLKNGYRSIIIDLASRSN